MSQPKNDAGGDDAEGVLHKNVDAKIETTTPAPHPVERGKVAIITYDVPTYVTPKKTGNRLYASGDGATKAVRKYLAGAIQIQNSFVQNERSHHICEQFSAQICNNVTAAIRINAIRYFPCRYILALLHVHSRSAPPKIPIEVITVVLVFDKS